MKLVLTLLLSFALASVAAAQTISAWTFDGVRAPTQRSNSGLAYFQNSSDNDARTIGNVGPDTNRRTWNPIIGFELPTLTEAIQNVTFSFTRTETNSSWSSWQVQLYAFQPGWNPRTQSVLDVFHMGGYTGSNDEGTVFLEVDPAMPDIDDRPWVRHLPNPANSDTGSVMTSTSPADGSRIQIDLTSFFTGSGVLADFYNPDGTPTTDYIWFRLSADSRVTGVQRIRVFNQLNESDSPELSFTVVPEPAFFGLTAGLLVFGAVLGLRRRIR